MPRGRRPEPAALKEAKGNPGKRALPKAAPATIGGVKPAVRLRTPARAIWGVLAPELERLNFLRPTDAHAFSRYCDTLATYWEVSSKLAKVGVTYDTDSAHGAMKRIHPLFLVQERLFRRLTDLEDRFGLSPASRQSIMLRLGAGQGSLPLPTPTRPGAEADPAPADAPVSPIGMLSGITRH